MKVLLIFVIVLFSTLLSASEKQVLVEMKTNLGKVVIELFPDKAPKTVSNFLQYVNEGFYDGIVFHRIIGNFMVQAGGFTTTHERKNPAHPPVKNEADNLLSNVRGTIAMARTNNPHSATSQFFINVVDNKALDYKGDRNWGYCVFGKVVEGMDVIDEIKLSATGVNPKNGARDWPKTDVVIESMKIVGDK